MLTNTAGAAAWVLASVAVSSALVRLILGVLAAHAARTALRPSDPAESAHRLAVLRALLKEVKASRR
jgi:ABC-type arginine transport system permease subunit